ncbi:transmembrane protein [Chytridium lagenaria]|nr:transmembrane protein [Chytridium lagenaria]
MVGLFGTLRVQYILLASNTIILFVRFTHTYPFRAGMVKIMFKEFRGHLLAIGAYHMLLLGCRGVGVPEILRCNNDKCDPWTSHYQTAYTIFRFASIPQYYAFKRAITRLCDPKYYKDSPWLRAKMHQSSSS